jgi:hypothetical protein
MTLPCTPCAPFSIYRSYLRRVGGGDTLSFDYIHDFKIDLSYGRTGDDEFIASEAVLPGQVIDMLEARLRRIHAQRMDIKYKELAG